jgi:hypothetical protein
MLHYADFGDVKNPHFYGLFLTAQYNYESASGPSNTTQSA